MYDGVTDAHVHLGDIMIREHLAVAYHGQSKEDIEEQHIQNRMKVSKFSSEKVID